MKRSLESRANHSRQISSVGTRLVLGTHAIHQRRRKTHSCSDLSRATRQRRLTAAAIRIEKQLFSRVPSVADCSFAYLTSVRLLFVIRTVARTRLRRVLLSTELLLIVKCACVCVRARAISCALSFLVFILLLRYSFSSIDKAEKNVRIDPQGASIIPPPSLKCIYLSRASMSRQRND